MREKLRGPFSRNLSYSFVYGYLYIYFLVTYIIHSANHEDYVIKYRRINHNNRLNKYYNKIIQYNGHIIIRISKRKKSCFSSKFILSNIFF